MSIHEDNLHSTEGEAGSEVIYSSYSILQLFR